MFILDNHIILTPISIILYDLQTEININGGNLLHTIKPQRYETQDIVISCPVHNNGLEKHPSASVTTIEKHKNNRIIPAGYMYCFSCKASMRLEQLVSYCFGKNDNGIYGKKWLIDKYTNYDTNNRKSMFKKLKEKEIYVPMYISEEELKKYRYTHPYVYQRHINDETIYRYDIGYDKEFILREGKEPLETITFPVRNINGQTEFICRRAISSKIFHYDAGAHKAIYGLYEANKYFPNSQTMYVCESIFNALTLHQYGFCSCALLGTGSKDQIEILKTLPYRKYIFFLDNDSAGIKATKKLIMALKSTHLVSVKQIKDPNTDINDLGYLSKNEFKKHTREITQREFMYEYSDI